MTLLFALLLFVAAKAMPVQDSHFNNVTALNTLTERDDPTLAYFFEDIACQTLVGVLSKSDYVANRGPTGCFTTPNGVTYGSATLKANGNIFWGNKCEHPGDKPHQGGCLAFKNNKPISGVKF